MKTHYLQDFVNKTRQHKTSLFCLTAGAFSLLAGQPLSAAASPGERITAKAPDGEAAKYVELTQSFANCNRSKSLFDRMLEKKAAAPTPFPESQTRALLAGTDSCPGTNIPAGNPVNFNDSDTTIGATSTVNTFNSTACTGQTASGGPDKIYKFVLPALGSRVGSCSITVDPVGATGTGYDASVYILSQGGGGCPPDGATNVSNCVQGKDAAFCDNPDVITDAQMDALPAGIYYLFVDSFYSSGGGPCGASRHQGAYTLNFTCTTLSPTAAMVGVGGRVTTQDGRGIGKVKVTVTLPSGENRFVLTNAFGFYNFDGIEAGQAYVFSVTSKGHDFSAAAQVISVQDTIQDLNFVADGPLSKEQ